MSLLRTLFKRVIRSTNAYPNDYWPSVVVLLKSPEFPTADEMLSKAQVCWGAHTPVEALATTNEGASHILRSGVFRFSVHFATQQYDTPTEGRDDIYERPWKEHTAWMSVDLPGRTCNDLRAKESLGDVYKMLLIYVFKSWSENCLAVHFPAEGITVPNLGGLAESIQWARRNGVNLAFLN